MKDEPSDCPKDPIERRVWQERMKRRPRQRGTGHPSYEADKVKENDNGREHPRS